MEELTARQREQNPAADPPGLGPEVPPVVQRVVEVLQRSGEDEDYGGQPRLLGQRKAQEEAGETGACRGGEPRRQGAGDAGVASSERSCLVRAEAVAQAGEEAVEEAVEEEDRGEGEGEPEGR